MSYLFYLYAYGNPVFYTDPDGNAVQPIIYSTSINQHTDIIAPIRSVDTGNHAVDLLGGVGSTVYNAAGIAVNGAFAALATPSFALSAATGDDFERTDMSLLSASMSNPYTMGVGLAYRSPRMLARWLKQGKKLSSLSKIDNIPSQSGKILLEGKSSIANADVPVVQALKQLPAPGQSSFNIGERLVSRKTYDEFIFGQEKFKMGAPWETSFFFNKPGANNASRSLDAAVNTGFTRDNIVDTINLGHNELMRLRFKTDKLNQIAVPGQSKVSGGIGDGEIPGTNELFTGTGKTKTLYGDDGFDEYIGNNVFLNQEDIISVESLGKIKK